jgi:glyoxylase I family protein
MKIISLHHVSLPVTDIQRSRRFYREFLGLAEIKRPPLPFDGAWFDLGNGQQLHLIVAERPTLRLGKPLDPRDTHFAIRVADFEEVVESLKAAGMREGASGEANELRCGNRAGFPQAFLLDPDRNVIEINSA